MIRRVCLATVLCFAAATLSGAGALRAAAPAHRYLIVAAELPSYVSVVEITGPTGRIERVLARPGHAQSFAASWSPDGTMIAFAGAAGLIVERTDGTGKRLLVPVSKHCTKVCVPMTLAWSPDGARLLVGGAGTQTNRFLVVAVRSGRASDVFAPKPDTEYSAVGWTRDGHIVYVLSSARNSCCTLELVTARTDGSRPRTLFTIAEPIHDFPAASLSPDGRTLAFTTGQRDPHDPRFALVDVATGAIRVLNGVKAMSTVPAWSPDSRRVAVAQFSGDVVTLAANGGSRRSLGVAGSQVAWDEQGNVIIAAGTLSQLVYQSDGGSRPAHLLFRMPKNQAILAFAAR